jgi:outer membrane lipoprotein-sorting protein
MEYPLQPYRAAPNLTLSLQMHGATPRYGNFLGGESDMNQRRRVPGFPGQTRMTAGFAAFLIAAGFAASAFAEGGQTEVSKTTPSNPPPAQAAPAAPAQPAPAPVPPSTAAAKPSGSAAPSWQTNVAQPPAPESDQQVLAKVNSYFNKMASLQGSFIQTDPDTQQKQGKFYLARPGKIRFDYSPPSSLKVVSDGVYLVVLDKEQKTNDRYFLEQTPFRLLLAESVDLARDANVLSIEQGPDTIVLQLEDKKIDSPGKIRLFFNRADMTLKEWIVTDPQGLNTRVEVSGLEENGKIDPDLFALTRSSGFHLFGQ